MRAEAKKPADKEEEQGMNVPISFVRFLLYVFLFVLMLLPFYFDLWNWMKVTSVAMVLAHFAGQLNEQNQK